MEIERRQIGLHSDMSAISHFAKHSLPSNKAKPNQVFRIQPMNRQLGLCTLLLSVFLLTIGCQPNADSGNSRDKQQPATPAVSSVPLRVLSSASDRFNQRLENAWRSVSDQPLKIETVAAADLPSKVTQSDVVIFQNQEMGELQKSPLLSSIPLSLLDSPALAEKTLLTSLVNDTMRWSDERVALPLGTIVPALCATLELAEANTENWENYDQTIQNLAVGESAEPLADGWAGFSFLYRASSLTGGTWLFDRQSFSPVLNSPPYLRALQQLVEARKRYPTDRLTPEQIWSRLNAGELKLAIGWPAGQIEDGSASAGIRIEPMPYGKEVYLDSWQARSSTPVVSFASSRGLVVALSASCRQSSAARSLMSWMVSADGINALRGSDNGVLPIRREILEAEDSDRVFTTTSNDPLQASFDAHLVRNLGTAQIRPSLRIPAASQYMEILDRQVIAACEGEITSEDALQQVVTQWEQLTEKLGRREQANAWRQAQGMRER